MFSISLLYSIRSHNFENKLLSLSLSIAPVVKCHKNVHVLRPHSSQSKNESQKAIHSVCDFEDEPQNIVIHNNCFNAPDPSTLGNIP